MSASVELSVGTTVEELRLSERLVSRGYHRVRRRPKAPGEFFWGHDVFWIWRKPVRALPDRLRAELKLNGNPLVGAALERPDGKIVSLFAGSNRRSRQRLFLEPVVLSESLRESRAARRPATLEEMPEVLWLALLAAEDHRFFDHSGLEARSIARAMLRNAKAGRVVQGGSTITQQLIKNRDLSPKRTLGRKASEAFRSLAIEAEYDKREILAAYLNTVYMGHVDGVALHGFGVAAQAYFGRPVGQLSTAQAVVLAAMVQGPNRLSPLGAGAALGERYRWILSRLAELEWLDAREAKRLSDRALPKVPAGAGARIGSALHRPLTALLAAEVETLAPDRWTDGRGFWVETGIDDYLQERAEVVVSSHLDRLRSRSRSHRAKAGQLQAVLVAVEPSTGRIRAYVGGDPAATGESFDRARNAQRQPGSTLKPLVLLEALQSCGKRSPLHPATRVADRAISVDAPGGVWRPQNSDDRFRGEVDLRQAVRESLNVPFVHIAGWCGFDSTVRRLRRGGLELPDDPPPSFVLGAVETTPLRLLEAFEAVAYDGWSRPPRGVTSVRNASGRHPRAGHSAPRPVVDRATAYLVRNLLQEAVESGTGRSAVVPGLEAWGKTGTSSDRRDAWFVGGIGDLLAVVWVGFDDGSPLGLTGSQAAAPIWQEFMRSVAVDDRLPRPTAIVERWIDERTGLRVDGAGSGRRRELFRRRHMPPRSRWYRKLLPSPVVGDGS